MNQKFLNITLGFTILLFLYSLWYRVVDVDDAWLAEHAYWLSELGYVKSELMRGITQQEVRVLLHHKLLIGLGALSIEVFGLSVYVLKSITLLCFGGFLWLFYRFMVVEKEYFNKLDFGFAVLILLSHHLVFKYAFVYRPEVMMLLWGFISFIFLNRTYDNPSFKNTGLSGLFAAFCLLTHLNGIAFLGAGFLCLALERQWKSTIYFGLIGGLTCLFYFWDFTHEYNLAFWFDQLNNNPYHKTPFGTQLLINLFTEQSRFFHSPIEFALSVLLITGFMISYPILKREQARLLRYTGLLIFFIALISLYKTTKYMIPYLPYLVTMIVLAWKHLFSSDFQPPKRLQRFSTLQIRQFFWLLIILYLGIQHFFNFRLIGKNGDISHNANLRETFVQTPIPKTKVIAPMDFIFNEIELFERIQSELSFSELQKANPNLKGAVFLQQAYEQDIDYIFLSKDFQETLGVKNYDNPIFKDYYQHGGYGLKGIMVLENIKISNSKLQVPKTNN